SVLGEEHRARLRVDHDRRGGVELGRRGGCRREGENGKRERHGNASAHEAKPDPWRSRHSLSFSFCPATRPCGASRGLRSSRLETLTPVLIAMAPRVSPVLTTYVRRCANFDVVLVVDPVVLEGVVFAGAFVVLGPLSVPELLRTTRKAITKPASASTA